METTQTLIALLVVACLFILISAIQIHYQKKSIIDFERDIKKYVEKLRQAELKQAANLEEIRNLKWQIANPAKYKKGDKVGDYIITSCEIHKPNLPGFIAQGIMALISIAAGCKPENPKDLFEMQWQYQLTHTVSGDKKKMTEREITNFNAFPK